MCSSYAEVVIPLSSVNDREVAQRLFVTEKTVETHLSATYRKLGLRTRRELRRALEP